MIQGKGLCGFERARGLRGQKFEREVTGTIISQDDLTTGVPKRYRCRPAKCAFVWIEIGEYAHAAISLFVPIETGWPVSVVEALYRIGTDRRSNV